MGSPEGLLRFVNRPNPFTFGNSDSYVNVPTNVSTSGLRLDFPGIGIGNDLKQPNGTWFGGDTTRQTNTGNFGSIAGGLLSIGQLAGIGLAGYTGLKSLGLARQQLGMAREQFGFNKALANRNLANQAQTINNAYDSAAGVAAGMAGRFGVQDPDIYRRYAEEAKKRHVDGSPVTT